MARTFGNLTYGDYQPQYVGQDIEGIKAISQKANESYDANLGAQNAMDILQNEDMRKVRPEDAPTVKAAYDKAQADLKSIKDSGRWEDSEYKIRKVAKDYAMNNDVLGAKEKKANYDAWLADLNKRVGMKPEEGGITTEQRDNAVRLSTTNPANNQPVKWNPETLKYEGQFRGYTPVKYQDIGAKMFALAKDWKASTEPITLPDGRVVRNTANGYQDVTTKEYVNEDEINKNLRTVILANPEDKAYIEEQEMFHKENNFKNPDGTYREANNNDLAKIGIHNSDLQKEGIDINMLTPEQKSNLYQTVIRNKTLDSYTNPAAAKESYAKYKTTYLKDWISEAYLKDKLKNKEQEESIKLETAVSDKKDNKIIENPLEGTPLDGAEFNDDGSLKATKIEGIGSYVATGKVGGLDLERSKKQVEFIVGIQKDNPSLKGLSPKEVSEAYAQARQNSAQYSNRAKVITAFNTPSVTKSIVDDLTGRSFEVQGGGTDNTLTGAIKDLGLNEDQIRERLLAAKTNSIVPSKNGAYKFQIQDSDGKPREVIISANQIQQKYHEAISKISANEKNGKTGYHQFVAQDPLKINLNKGNVDDRTKSEFATYTQIRKDEDGSVTGTPGSYYNDTRGGRILSKAVTENFLKQNPQLKNYTKEQLLENGVVFTPDGRLVESLSAEQMENESTESYVGSKYFKQFRKKETNNPLLPEDVTDESNNITED